MGSVLRMCLSIVVADGCGAYYDARFVDHESAAQLGQCGWFFKDI
jgi:hypothetical protein